MTEARILIVEDEQIISKTLRRSLQNLGYDVVATVTSGEDGVRTAEESRPDLVLMDISLEGEMDGIEAADEIRLRFDIPVVYLTGYAELDVLERAKETEPYGYLGKPVAMLDLRSTVETALYKHQMERRLRESERRYRQMFERNLTVKLLIDPDSGDIVDANSAAVEFYGYTLEELKQLKITDINLLQREQVFQEMAKAKSEKKKHFFFRHKLASGEVRDVEVYSGPVDTQEQTLLYSTVHDITRRVQAEEALKESENRYRLLTENSLTGIYTHRDGVFTYVNPRLAEMMGYAVEELIGREFWEFVHPEDRERIKERGLAIATGRRLTPTVEFRVLCKYGEIKWLEVFSHPVTHLGHTADMGNVVDITDRRRAEEALRESEERFRELAELMPEFVYELDDKGFFTFFNRPGLEKVLYTPHDIAEGLHALTIVVPEDLEIVQKDIATVLSGVRVNNREYTLLKKNGTTLPILTHSSPIVRKGNVVGIRGVGIDLTERKRAEQLIKASLQEKEVLLREIHHRVKNNLAVVCGLLTLQAEYATDDAHRKMFEDTETRVRSMALAHEKLYQTEDLASLDAGEYVGGLVDHLVDSSSLGMPIQLKKEIDDVSFRLDIVIPLGFILTELVSNCLRHAFPKGREGAIRISLRSVAEKEFELVVSDNGVGIPDGIDLQNPVSMGMDLVNTFASQINGDIEIRRDKGTEVRVRFGIENQHRGE
jgi:PAS domain S-box-containing protein